MSEGWCTWRGDDPLMAAYHDEEWGIPTHGEAELFEMLTLEGAQAGLSWHTILHRREGYRSAFQGFDAEVVATFDDSKVTELLADPGIIRHRGKIESTIANASRVLELRDSGGLDAFVWDVVGGTPFVRRPRSTAEVPATDARGDELSKRLRSAGFRFVGPTTAYAFCQAAGLVDDHLDGCPAMSASSAPGSHR